MRHSAHLEMRRRDLVCDEGAISAATPHAADAGLTMLEAGGNAVDAAVAAGFTAAVVEPHETCMGGSGFLLVHDPDRGPWSVEFPPRAPAASTPDMYAPIHGQGPPGLGALLGVGAVEEDANLLGYRASGVPGLVDGLCRAHRHFGRLSLADVVGPAVRLAYDGFEVTSYYTLSALHQLDKLRAWPEAAGVFLRDRNPPVASYLGSATLGTPPMIVQSDLGATLERIGERGRDGFYRGSTALRIGEEFQANGGALDATDLERYESTVRRPLSVELGDYQLHVPAAPNGGWSVAHILRILTALGDAARWPDLPAPVVESIRTAFRDRYAWFGDPDFVQSPIERLLARQTADTTARSIVAGEGVRWPAAGEGLPWHYFVQGAKQSSGGPTESQEIGWERGTTHFSVADRDHRVVSCTHSSGNLFGSKVVVPGTGVLFDASMVWFDPTRGRANSVAPNKRPLVNMAPMLLSRRGEPRLALGASGGRRIISAVAQVVWHMLARGLSLQEAIEEPRLDGSGTEVLISERADWRMHEQLHERGYAVRTVADRREPYVYELARPNGVAVGADGLQPAATAQVIGEAWGLSPDIDFGS